MIESLLEVNGGAAERMIAVKGNHEDAVLAFLDDPTTGPLWGDHGGRETLLSYGVEIPQRQTDKDAWLSTRDAFAKALPPAHLSFLHSLELSVTIGDYMFVHVGVRPCVPLEQ